MQDISKPMLIMTVANELSLPWLILQARYLNRFVTNYKQVFYLNNVTSGFDGEIVGSRLSNDTQTVQHVRGVKALKDYAETNKDKYRSFLLLDSDCFPINNWEERILLKMNELGRTSACAIRTENLDVFYHPCVCFSYEPIDCEIKEQISLLGEKVLDSTCVPKESVFPLLRTNIVNLHPVLSAIYYNSFYHHGAGSRPCRKPYDIRSCQNYYSVDRSIVVDLKHAVFNDTDKFLRLLNEGFDLRASIQRGNFFGLSNGSKNKDHRGVRFIL